jgi:hypothetical protein
MLLMALMALTVWLLVCIAPVLSYTDPAEVGKLLALRAEYTKFERGVAGYLSSWTCPPGKPCDPCGSRNGLDESWGHDGGGWEHIACRTYDLTPAELGGKPVHNAGVVTNIHITDLTTEGTLESLGAVLCPFNHLRELDLDGGHLSGSLPPYLATCFPHLHELDLSFNQLTGTIPTWIANGTLYESSVSYPSRD